MVRSAGPPQGADCAPAGGSAAAKPQAWGDQITLADDAIVDAPPGGERRWAGLALVIPALVVVGLFFVLPLLLSAVGAFRSTDGAITLAHLSNVLDFSGRDLVFTVAIVVLSTMSIACVAIAIAGSLTLGENPRSVALLRWLY